MHERINIKKIMNYNPIAGSLRSRFIALEAGEFFQVSVQEHRPSSIRSYASELGMMLGRTFKVNRIKDTIFFQVTRIS